jgi:hypothetical protein
MEKERNEPKSRGKRNTRKKEIILIPTNKTKQKTRNIRFIARTFADFAALGGVSARLARVGLRVTLRTLRVARPVHHARHAICRVSK